MTTPITRRGSLKALGTATIFAPALLRHASAQTPPLPPLPNLGANDALLLQPGQPGYDTYEPAANERMLLRPKLRALCKTANAVSVMVSWCRSNNLPFAIRSGGHSYEGFSQSASVVIDTRMLNQITFDRTARTMTVGAGATLGPVYEAIGAAGFGFPGGSCPTVGVAGHALGGGFGLIARPFGLACDNLQWLELVDPQGAITQVDAQHNPDLFWAARGGGGGSFGAVTRFRFKIYRISQVVVLGVTWRLPQARAVKLFQAWQAWAPQAPTNITTFLRVGHAAGGLLELHCAGQSIGSVAEFRRELRALTNVAQPVEGPSLEPMSFLNAAKHFFGGPAQPTFFKAKSDYITSPLATPASQRCSASLRQLHRWSRSATHMVEPSPGWRVMLPPSHTAPAHTIASSTIPNGRAPLRRRPSLATSARSTPPCARMYPASATSTTAISI